MKGRRGGKGAVGQEEAGLLERLIHDLRNPLGVIAYFAEAIPEAADAERGELCERLRINAERTMQVLEEFALLADLRHGRSQPAADEVDVGQLVREAAAQTTAGERVANAIDSRGAAGLVLVGDAQHWQRAMRALLRETLRGAAGDLVLEGERLADVVTLRVAVPLRLDRALGVRARIDPAGLGVELVQRLAALYGGELAISQRPGRGLLRLMLPARYPAQETAAAEAASTPYP